MEPQNEAVKTTPPAAPDAEANPPAAAEPTREELIAGIEAERALREIAESSAANATKDLIALKTGRKRKDIDLSQDQTDQPDNIQPAAQPQADATKTIADALAESNRVNAELMRAMASRGQGLPTGGSGQADSPAPKPKGYWSDEQKAYLKSKRGMSDAMIAKAEKLAQMGGANGGRTAEDVGIAKRTY